MRHWAHNCNTWIYTICQPCQPFDFLVNQEYGSVYCDPIGFWSQYSLCEVWGSMFTLKAWLIFPLSSQNLGQRKIGIFRVLGFSGAFRTVEKIIQSKTMQMLIITVFHKQLGQVVIQFSVFSFDPLLITWDHTVPS